MILSGNWSITRPGAIRRIIAIPARTFMSIAEKFVAMEYGPAPEDAKEALAWLDRHGRRFGHFINGTWVAPSAGTYFDTADPSTGEKLGTIAQGSAADVDCAVA